jgi:hypothetical protein
VTLHKVHNHLKHVIYINYVVTEQRCKPCTVIYPTSQIDLPIQLPEKHEENFDVSSEDPSFVGKFINVLLGEWNANMIDIDNIYSFLIQ